MVQKLLQILHGHLHRTLSRLLPDHKPNARYFSNKGNCSTFPHLANGEGIWYVFAAEFCTEPAYFFYLVPHDALLSFAIIGCHQNQAPHQRCSRGSCRSSAPSESSRSSSRILQIAQHESEMQIEADRRLGPGFEASSICLLEPARWHGGRARLSVRLLLVRWSS